MHIAHAGNALVFSGLRAASFIQGLVEHVHLQLHRHGGRAGRPENCFAGGGDGMGARRRRGGGVPEMGFRARPLILCKDGCCHQRRWNTNFGPENFFHEKIFPHICVVKMISAMWGSF